MVPAALLAGVPVALVAGAVVYADAAGRELPARARLGWSGGVAAASVLGFAAAAFLDGALVRAAAVLTGGPAVVTHPRQLVTWVVALGLAVSAAAVLAYGFGTRLGPFRAA